MLSKLNGSISVGKRVLAVDSTKVSLPVRFEKQGVAPRNFAAKKPRARRARPCGRSSRAAFSSTNFLAGVLTAGRVARRSEELSAWCNLMGTLTTDLVCYASFLENSVPQMLFAVQGARPRHHRAQIEPEGAVCGLH
jgi:hypothetical protein